MWISGKIHLKQSTESIFVKITGVNCDYGLADLEKAKEPRKEQMSSFLFVDTDAPISKVISQIWSFLKKIQEIIDETLFTNLETA